METTETTHLPSKALLTHNERKPMGINEQDTTPKYFAVPDPLDPDRITYWYRPTRGQYKGRLRPWPPHTGYHPLYTRDMPAGLSHSERRGFIAAHWDRMANAYAEIKNTVEADPDTAAATFAAFHTRCCRCGKALTDERSKTYGIGPECRVGMTTEVLAVFVDLVGRAHAKHIDPSTHLPVKASFPEPPPN